MKMITSSQIKPLLAVIILVSAMGYFYCASFNCFHAPEALLTHITQGLFDMIMLVVGYYWGSSTNKKTTDTPQP